MKMNRTDVQRILVLQAKNKKQCTEHGCLWAYACNSQLNTARAVFSPKSENKLPYTMKRIGDTNN